jgi:BCD family chlorophyll transporter-like MFS transporter
MLAAGGLLGFYVSGRQLAKGIDPMRLAAYGTLAGLPAFSAVIFSAPLEAGWLFRVGALGIGFGGGLFGHGTLTATMNLAPKEQSGLALGAWGAVQATAAGLAIALGGVIRDVVATQTASATAYAVVYGIEICLLIGTMYAMSPLIRRPALRQVTV